MPGPLISVAMVTSQNADTGELSVLLRTVGSVPGTCRMSYGGAADGLRIKQQALPGRGTWGLVAFPYGDIRNGIWLCSFYPGSVDAITSSVSGVGSNKLDPFLEYEAHFSGFWSMMTGSGWAAMQWADQSYATIAPASGLPVTTHHTVENGVRVKKTMAFSDRNPHPPNPFLFQFHHASGTTLTLDASGNMSVAGSGTISITASGTLSIAASGAVSVAASGAVTLTSTGNVSVSSAGQVDLSAASAKNFRVGGSSLGSLLAKATPVESAFNGHTHVAPAGGGPTSGPNSSMSSTGASAVSVSS